MAKLTDKQNKKIKRAEQEIQEENSLWEKIKSISKQDKLIPLKLRDFFKPSKVTEKSELTKSMKEKVNKTFWGLEPPEKPKKANKSKL